MVEFKNVHTDIVPVLKANGIKESDLFRHDSDLYVGCSSPQQASAVLGGGDWGAMSDVFFPQKGSDMDHYNCAVDIGHALLGMAFAERFGKYNIKLEGKDTEYFREIPKDVYWASGCRVASDKGKAYLMRNENGATCLIPLMETSSGLQVIKKED